LSWCIFDLAQKETRLHELTNKSELSDFWQNTNNAKQVMKEIADLRSEIDGIISLKKRCQDALDLASMQDESIRSELEKEKISIDNSIDLLELSTLLSGTYDKGNALLSIHSGMGGVDSQDWAAMLERMYLRWAEQQRYHTEVLDFSEGEEAGIKSVTIFVEGKYAFGYLRTEKGVHRLVRLSPFDAAHRRHTSFAQVEVLPEIVDEDPEITINPDDLVIDIYKSSGAGGQNVQKNATAIRITHKPTGVVVTCQNERSQIQNRENAMRVLRGRLYEIKMEEQEKKISELRGEFQKIEWGSQIRSYVLHPYQMIKDHRTNYEVGNTQTVLDGDIDGFIQAYLHMKK
jgi:peptide chain release factor 2